MSDELANTGKILIYQNEKGDTKIDVYFEEDTIWMTQKAMCELYQVAKSSVSEHISNIFKDGELEPEATVRKFRTVQIEGTRQVNRERDYYNLDMILAVGYRVRSNVGIHAHESDLTQGGAAGHSLPRSAAHLRHPRHRQDAKTLSGILGHTNASFTLDTYTHVTPDMQKAASGIVGGFMEDLLGKGLRPWQRNGKTEKRNRHRKTARRRPVGGPCCHRL